MAEPDSYVSVAAALDRLEQEARVGQKKIETISIAHAYGRVLARNMACNEDIPTQDKSHMDGFAVKADDIAEASCTNPSRLKVVGIAAMPARRPENELVSGQARMIFTGGFLPRGSDTVVPQEEAEMTTTGEGEKIITICSSLPKWSFVHRAGSEIRKGSQIFSEGKVLQAPDLGVLASLHILKVPVFVVPRVTIIPTGSELTDSTDVQQGRVLNTNSPVIAKLVEHAGGTALDLGVTKDNVSVIANKIRRALAHSDLILTIGGSSVGKYDIVQDAVNSIGRPGMLSRKVKLDRGRVTGIGAVKGKPIIILPGPIQGAASAFLVFAYPLIRMSAGYADPPPVFPAKLNNLWHAREKFRHFTKVVYTKLSFNPREGAYIAQPLHGETESMVLLARANSYIIVPERTTSMQPGQRVFVRMLPSFRTF